ncbi:MAG: hypothetical protein IPP96_16300 [Chitinophagaceae bacterium]|nr:hypothetical protein [Chitinophagaceae bacterium]
MKKYAIFLLAIVTWHSIYAQNEIKISELSIPTSPGFVLADKAPASIEKPTTPKAFGVSLLNLREGGAVEVTPYWLVNHPAYTFTDYFKKRKFPVLETFNISAATFKTDTTSSVSMGFRTQIVRLYSKAAREELEAKRLEIVGLLSVEDFTPEALEAIEKARKELSDLKSKITFNFEIAAAIIGSSKNNSFKNLQSDKSGVWANIRYRPKECPLDFTALARYSWTNNTNPKVGSDSAFFDYGLSLSFQKPKYDLALEFINRYDFSIKSNTNRLALVVNYMIYDNIVIVGSFGKNFDKVKNLLTVVGVKFGLSNDKAKIN